MGNIIVVQNVVMQIRKKYLYNGEIMKIAMQLIKQSEDNMQEIIEQDNGFNDFVLHGDAPNCVMAYLNFALARHHALRVLDEENDGNGVQ